jgi:hypothetical protein
MAMFNMSLLRKCDRLKLFPVAKICAAGRRLDADTHMVGDMATTAATAQGHGDGQNGNYGHGWYSHGGCSDH